MNYLAVLENVNLSEIERYNKSESFEKTSRLLHASPLGEVISKLRNILSKREELDLVLEAEGYSSKKGRDAIELCHSYVAFNLFGILNTISTNPLMSGLDFVYKVLFNELTSILATLNKSEHRGDILQDFNFILGREESASSNDLALSVIVNFVNAKEEQGFTFDSVLDSKLKPVRTMLLSVVTLFTLVDEIEGNKENKDSAFDLKQKTVELDALTEKLAKAMSDCNTLLKDVDFDSNNLDYLLEVLSLNVVASSVEFLSERQRSLAH